MFKAISESKVNKVKTTNVNMTNFIIGDYNEQSIPTSRYYHEPKQISVSNSYQIKHLSHMIPNNSTFKFEGENKLPFLTTNKRDYKTPKFDYIQIKNNDLRQSKLLFGINNMKINSKSREDFKNHTRKSILLANSVDLEVKYQNINPINSDGDKTVHWNFDSFIKNKSNLKNSSNKNIYLQKDFSRPYDCISNRYY